MSDYARHHDVNVDSAREAVLEHAPSLAESGMGYVKVRLRHQKMHDDQLMKILSSA